MTALKKVELGFRRTLLWVLQQLVHRRRSPLPPDFDFNRSKVLFIRQDRIGDVLVSTPLFALLKNRYPGITIDILLSKNNSFVLDQDTLVRKRWVYTKEVVSTMKVIRGLRSERYDFVVDLMDNPSATSTVAMVLTRGKWNIGLQKENGFVYDIVVPMLSRKESHIVDRLSKLLEPFGIKAHSKDLRVRYSSSPSSDTRVEEFLKSHGVNGPIIGVNISAGSDTRFWGIENYRQLLSQLMKHDPAVVILLLSKPSDRSRAKEISNGNTSVVLAPETTFDEFAAFIKCLRVLITPDTSAVHLAAAFGIPSVILYVQSNTNLRIWEPYNTECETIVTTVDDLSAIAVTQVFDAYVRLHNRIAPRRTVLESKSHHGV